MRATVCTELLKVLDNAGMIGATMYAWKKMMKVAAESVRSKRSRS